MSAYDVIVAGAGPAGSMAARLLAKRGARVLLLDKQRFPRDKPCGGGVTLRAAALLDIDLSPVIERTIHGARFTLRLGEAFDRRFEQPLTYMTQRSRLDAYLAERAAEAGAEFRDGVALREIEVDGTSSPKQTVRTERDSYTAPVLIGADGANGLSVLITIPYFSLTVVVSTLFVILILRVIWLSPFGRVIRMIREGDRLPLALGKNVLLFKLETMAIGGAIGGLGGSFYALLNSYISPDDGLPIETFIIWAMVVVGGRGNLLGVVAGTVFIQILFVGSRFLTHIVDIDAGVL
ncbi:MAG: FAD-dependent monooxygenase, partial [Chloroflexi bacterium]|nr:FAD-dependent monooxygenase [Chloroflexota bacterium]